MKQKYIWAIIILVIIAIGAYLFLLSNNAVPYEKVNIYTTKDFDKASDTPILTIKNKKSLREISRIIKESQQLPGVLDVSQPSYIMEIHEKRGRDYAAFDKLDDYS